MNRNERRVAKKQAKNVQNPSSVFRNVPAVRLACGHFPHEHEEDEGKDYVLTDEEAAKIIEANRLIKEVTANHECFCECELCQAGINTNMDKPEFYTIPKVFFRKAP